MKFDLSKIKAVLLAGGKGTRLAPYTTVLPKPLMPIQDMPIAEVLIRQLYKAGVKDITFSVGYLSSLIRAYFGSGEKFGVNVSYSEEHRPLGTAAPLALVPNLNETFLVLNGDILTTLDFGDMVRFHKEKGGVATIGLFDKEVQINLGVIETDSKGCVSKYIEKPKIPYKVSIGAYVFEPEVLKYLKADERFD